MEEQSNLTMDTWLLESEANIEKNDVFHNRMNMPRHETKKRTRISIFLVQISTGPPFLL